MANLALAILVINVIAILVLWKRDQNVLYAIFSLSLLVLFGMTVANEFTHEWQGYQKEFIKLQIEKESDPEIISSLKDTEIKIKQIWNDELDVADRCTTCHLAVDNPNFKDAPEPFRYHEASREHQFKKLGCTICHQGQGRATTTEHAHAKHISHWDYPMWESDMVQASCPQCHEQLYNEGYELEGAERIVEARRIVNGNNELEMPCTFCHTIRGEGEVLGPDLTEYGVTTEHEFEATHNMNHVEGHKDKYNWTFEHFLDPQKITPGNPETGVAPTIMPDFGFTREEAHNLTLFVFSMKPSLIPAKYQYQEYRAKGSEPSFIEEFEKGYDNFDALPRGQQIFIRSNCWFCHTLDGKGGKVGPELTDVGARLSQEKIRSFFDTLEGNTKHPMGNRFNFSDEEKEALAEYLSTLD